MRIHHSAVEHTRGALILREMEISEEVIQAIADRVLKKMETGTSSKQSSTNKDSGETSGRSEASGGGSMSACGHVGNKRSNGKQERRG